MLARIAPSGKSRNDGLKKMRFKYNSGDILISRLAGVSMNIAKRILILVLAFVFFQISHSIAEPSCNSQTGMPVIDISQPVTTITTTSGKTGVEAFKVIGVKTIARYYDWAAPDITCKSLLPSESDVIIGAGLNILTIFQHENSDPETFFDAGRGAKERNFMHQANGVWCSSVQLSARAGSSKKKKWCALI